VSKGNRRGLVRDHPRLRARTQKAALQAKEFDPIYELGKDCTIEDAVKSMRPGNVAGVARLWVIADLKRGRKGGARQTLYSAVDAIEARGATIEEVDTGRVSSDPKQRDAMIRDAAEAVTRGGRGLKSAGNLPRGRKALDFSEPVTAKAKTVWESRKYKTWADAAAAMPKGFTVHRAFRLWGKRNSD
jgi:hypothetical protein